MRAAALASTGLTNSKDAEDLANEIAELLTEHSWKAVSLQGVYSTDPTPGIKLEVRVKGANTDVTPESLPEPANTLYRFLDESVKLNPSVRVVAYPNIEQGSFNIIVGPESLSRFCWLAFWQHSLGAWSEQYVQNKGGLSGEILSLVWNEANATPGKTLVFLQARIVNNGSPTIVNSYELQALLADGIKLNGASLYLRDGIELQSETETTRITKVIYEETLSPIAQGGQAVGWICGTRELFYVSTVIDDR